MQQYPFVESLDELPTHKEITKAIIQTQSREFLSSISICPEIFNKGGAVIILKMTELMQLF